MKTVTTGLMTLLALGALVACSSSHKSTIQTSNGAATVTTSQDDKNVTIRTKEGTTAIGQNVDTDKLGAPVYPGAKAGQGQSITTSSDQGSTVIAAFTTADEFEKVYDFYKDHMPAGSEKMKVSSGNGSMASFQIGDQTAGDQVTVQVSSDKPTETDILITHVAKTGAAAASASPDESPLPSESPSPAGT